MTHHCISFRSSQEVFKSLKCFKVDIFLPLRLWNFIDRWDLSKTVECGSPVASNSTWLCQVLIACTLHITLIQVQMSDFKFVALWNCTLDVKVLDISWNTVTLFVSCFVLWRTRKKVVDAGVSRSVFCTWSGLRTPRPYSSVYCSWKKFVCLKACG